MQAAFHEQARCALWQCLKDYPLRRVAIHGPPGIGKTTLAAGVLAEMQLTAAELAFPHECTDDVHKEFSARLASGDFDIALLDNVDSEGQGHVAAALTRQFPDKPFVIAGRFRLGVDSDWLAIRLDPATASDSEAFIRTRCEHLDTQSVQRIVGGAHGIPLALHLLTCRIRRGHGVDSSLAALDDQSLGLIDPADGIAGRPERVLREIVDVAISTFRQDLPRESDHLSNLAILPDSGFDASLARAVAGTTVRDIENTLAKALDYGLLELRGGVRWRFHPFVRQRLVGLGSPDAFRRLGVWVSELVGAEESQTDANTFQYLDVLDLWLRGAELVDLANLPENASNFAIRVGPQLAWLAACERILAEVPLSEELAHFSYGAAIIAHLAGEFERAEALAQLATVSLLGSDDQATAMLASSLRASALCELGRFSEALSIDAELILPTLNALPDDTRNRVAMEVANRQVWSGSTDGRTAVRAVLEAITEPLSPAIASMLEMLTATALTEGGAPEAGIRFIDTVLMPAAKSAREQARLASMKANALAYTGRIADAIALRTEAIPIFEQRCDTMMIIQCWYRNALDAKVAGNHEDAVRYALKAHEVGEKAGVRYEPAESLLVALRNSDAGVPE